MTMYVAAWRYRHGPVKTGSARFTKLKDAQETATRLNERHKGRVFSFWAQRARAVAS